MVKCNAIMSKHNARLESFSIIFASRVKCQVIDMLLFALSGIKTSNFSLNTYTCQRTHAYAFAISSLC